MDKKVKKLESNRRIEELKPVETLMNIDINEKTVLLDYGAGTGIFTIPASRITKDKVYAYDIDENMINIIKQKSNNESIENIYFLKNKNDLQTVPNNSVDHILLVTVYHEIKDIEDLFMDFNYLLKENGKVTILEFHYKETPMGPPLSYRIPKDRIIEEFKEYRFNLSYELILGENLNLITFKRRHYES